MSLSIEQQTQLIDHFFDVLHPEVCKDDHNIGLISNFIREKTRGMEYLNRAALEWAIADLAGRLRYYAGVDLSAQLAAGAEAQQRLADELSEKNRKAEVLRRELERDARQDARQPGASSAFANQDDVASEKERARKTAEAAIQRHQRHAKFRERLSEANIYWEPNHAAKIDRKRQLMDAIKRDFPEFAQEIR